MNRAHTDEQGSALVEAALVIPVLLLLVCGSVALTDAVAAVDPSLSPAHS